MVSSRHPDHLLILMPFLCYPLGLYRGSEGSCITMEGVHNTFQVSEYALALQDLRVVRSG